MSTHYEEESRGPNAGPWRVPATCHVNVASCLLDASVALALVSLPVPSPPVQLGFEEATDGPAGFCVALSGHQNQRINNLLITHVLRMRVLWCCFGALFCMGASYTTANAMSNSLFTAPLVLVLNPP